MPDPRSLMEEDLYDERNPFLDILLGLISLSERTLSTVADLAPPLPALEPEAPRPPGPGGAILR